LIISLGRGSCSALTTARAAKEKSLFGFYILCVLLLIEIINLALTTNSDASLTLMYLFTFFISAEALRMFQSISNQLTRLTDWFLFLCARRVWNIWPGQIYLCLMLMWENSRSIRRVHSTDRFLRRKLTCAQHQYCAPAKDSSPLIKSRAFFTYKPLRGPAANFCF
jgi:hypothetical protein